MKKNTIKRQDSPPPFLDRIALFAIALAALAALAAALAGFGHRLGWWHFATGFSILRWAASSALAGIVLSLWGIFRTRPRRGRKGFSLALVSLVLNVAAVAVPLYWLFLARSVPPIHDITTDIENPPVFSVLLPVRAEAPNSSDYGGPAIAAQQQEAYPDIKPLRLPLNTNILLEEALAVAQRLKWKVIGVESDGTKEGNIRFEATDSTFWFGFKDDIVVRITPLDNGSRIDVRSVSRLGRSDVGANARRIRAFLEALKARVADEYPAK